MKLFIKIAAVLGVLAIIGLVGFILFLGDVVRSGVETVGPVVTKVPVKLNGASVSILNGSGRLDGFVLGNPEGFKTTEAIKVGSVSLKLVPSSVLADKVIVRSIVVDGPEITYETDLRGSNLGKILENIQSLTSGGSSNAAAGQTALQVDEFVISSGKIRLGASMLGAGTADFPLPEIRLANLGQGPEGITPAELSAKALGAILEGTVAAVARNSAAAGKQMLDGAKQSGTTAVENAKRIGSGVTELFKGKDQGKE